MTVRAALAVFAAMCAAALTHAQPANPALAAEHHGAEAKGADVAIAEILVRRGRDNVWACAGCHGASGEGNETAPRLAGLPAGYLVKQLHDYRSGQRKNDNMAFVVASLADDEMSALGRYYAALDTPSAARPTLGGSLARGAALATGGDWSIGVPACFACHGPGAVGVEPAFPALGGQQAAYIYAQLVAWVSGSRGSAPPAVMHAVAQGLSDPDRRAVADYMASLPPPPGRQEASP
ncbi:MAG: c-type cytochrome [Devosia sp.]